MAKTAGLKRGGPGRPKGVQNRVTVEAREYATRLVTDPAYISGLERRLIEGTAGSMEPLLWAFAYGKPKERLEVDQHRRLNQFKFICIFRIMAVIPNLLDNSTAPSRGCRNKIRVRGNRCRKYAVNPADRAGCFAGLYESHRNGCTSDGRTNGRETSVPAMGHGDIVLAKNSGGLGWG